MNECEGLEGRKQDKKEIVESLSLDNAEGSQLYPNGPRRSCQNLQCLLIMWSMTQNKKLKKKKSPKMAWPRKPRSTGFKFTSTLAEVWRHLVTISCLGLNACGSDQVPVGAGSLKWSRWLHQGNDADFVDSVYWSGTCWEHRSLLYGSLVYFISLFLSPKSKTSVCCEPNYPTRTRLHFRETDVDMWMMLR